jgi:hypothetical protein
MGGVGVIIVFVSTTLNNRQGTATKRRAVSASRSGPAISSTHHSLSSSSPLSYRHSLPLPTPQSTPHPPNRSLT